MQTPDQIRDEIIEYLRNYIESGNLAPGDKLPSENCLAQRFATNRNTVRSALLVLKARGMIRSSRGRGFFMEEQPDRFTYRFNQMLGLSESLKHENAEHAASLIGQQVRPCTQAEAELLRLEEGEPIVELLQLRMVNGQKTAVCTSLIPEKFIPGLQLGPDEFQGTNHILIEKYGLPHPVCRRVVVSACLPEPEEQALLGIPESVPILQQEILYTIHGDEPIEAFTIRARGDSFQLSVKMT